MAAKVTAEAIAPAEIAQSADCPEPPSTYTLKCVTSSGTIAEVELSSFGATVTKFLLSGGTGNGNNERGNDDNSESNSGTVDKSPNTATDIVLGYKDGRLMGEEGNPFYFGCIVGRVANRLREGKFSLEGRSIHLECNNPPNHLHGGARGFGQRYWNGHVLEQNDDNKQKEVVRFVLESEDGDQGYPGSLHVTATYTLRQMHDDQDPDSKQQTRGSTVVLRLEMEAILVGDKKTPINLAQHSYFNLAGNSNSSCGILNHMLQIEADGYLPVDENSIPTRQVCPLDDDPVMDWRIPRNLKGALRDYATKKVGLSKDDASKLLESRCLSDHPFGFDHNYVVRKPPLTESTNKGNLFKVARLSFENRHLTVYSNAPGVQLYTANYLGNDDAGGSDQNGKLKGVYGAWQGLCLETQHFPDSVSENLEPSSPFGAGKCVILGPERRKYCHVVEYHVLFSAAKEE